MPVPFQEALHEYHQTLLNGSDEQLLDRTFRDHLGYLIEAMKNIDSYAKETVFDDLLRHHPELDYEPIAQQIAQTLGR